MHVYMHVYIYICFISFAPGQDCFFSIGPSTSSLQKPAGQKLIKQAEANYLKTNALHYLCTTLLQAIAEKT